MIGETDGITTDTTGTTTGLTMKICILYTIENQERCEPCADRSENLVYVLEIHYGEDFLWKSMTKIFLSIAHRLAVNPYRLFMSWRLHRGSIGAAMDLHACLSLAVSDSFTIV